MKKAKVSFILTILAGAVIVAGCSHQSTPTTPGDSSNPDRAIAALSAL
jgi:PBP1b-binding outer membrane lipoprotein LpoB